MKKYTEKLALISSLAIIFFIGFLSINDKSMTWDEACYIGVGKYIFKTGNFKINALAYHPILSFYINSIFLTPFKFGEEIYLNDNCWQNGYNMVYHSEYDPKLLLILARLPFIIISMIFALYVYYWSKQLYGLKSGLLALVLYTFNTSILSQSNLALTDFTATFFIFVTMYYYWKYVALNQKKYLYITSIFFGLSLMSKLTGLILIPVLSILIIYDLFKRKLNSKNLFSGIKKIFIIFIVGFLIIFAGYGFQFGTLKSAMPEHYVNRAYEEFGKHIGSDTLRKYAIYFFEKTHLPSPSYFFDIGYLALQANTGIGGRFIDGKFFTKPPWFYPIKVLLYKTEVSLIILTVLSIVFFKKIMSRKIVDEYVQILPVLVVFILFTILNNAAGLRHILPLYPFLFVFCSKLARLKKIWLNIVIIILIAHYIINSLLIFPHYLAYFNEIVGGPANGYKHLVGSDLDIGQDLPGLKLFMEENKIDKINLSYFGSIDPKEYVNYDYLPSPYFQQWVPDFVQYVTLTERYEDCSEKKGWVAISVTNLQNMRMVNKTCFNWMKKYEPVAKIGYSIFVYNISN